MIPGGTADRWRRLKELIEAALERDTSERDAFLDDACAGDFELRQELETLLAAHESTGALDGLVADLAPLAARLQAPPARSFAAAMTPGQSVGRYRVLEQVGGGGMGIVYRATDERLGRAVALKFLHPRFGADDSAAERFRHEARTVASLEHPNVCTVHEIGETDDGQLYLAMPLYHGETLQQRIARGPLPVGEAVGIAVQIARGLARAHAQGIVHRDIKPSNVFVTDDGVVKILDFGIAKLADVTLTGSEVGPEGTLAYMSPEQLRGARVDHRSDIWSLGVVLSEMLAGERPFRGHETLAVRAAILDADPAATSTKRNDVPAALDRVVSRALTKSSDARYDSAPAVERDLLALGLAPGVTGVAIDSTKVSARPRWRWWARRPRGLARGAAVAAAAVAVSLGLAAAVLWAGRTRGERTRTAVVTPNVSIVVLPFVNMSRNGDNEYFSDGITEEIITQLSTVPTLKVISRTSAMHYKKSTKSLRQIAGELGVAHVLEGSILREGNRVRITAQLIDAGDDHHLWSRSYVRQVVDVIGVQDEIAREVSRALEVELGGARGAPARRGTRDPEAYEFYRRGRYLWAKRTKASHEQAIAYYRRAIERDSGYSDAYAGLADAYVTAYQFNISTIPEAEVYARIKWAAGRALALDDQSADAHTSYAVALWWQQNWPGAERELLRALELNPGNGPRGWYALLLAGMGRVDEAVQQNRRVTELDPFSLLGSVNGAWLRYVARDYDGAIEESRRALEINDAWAPAYSELGLIYAQKGMDDAATRAASKAVELGGPQVSAWQANLAYVHARAGRRAEAERFLKLAKTHPWEGFTIARAYVGLGEPDSAFAWLDRSSWKWPHRAVRADPALDPLRSDPRFIRLSARIEREMGIR
ncbi:MAG: protein kinase domain-containing protein [Gemmatimonadaceae bacterium]